MVTAVGGRMLEKKDFSASGSCIQVRLISTNTSPERLLSSALVLAGKNVVCFASQNDLKL